MKRSESSIVVSKQTMKRSKPVNVPYIPQELQLEILLRLPIESVISFKLVSKQWKNLINDPNFINRYNNKSLALFLTTNSLYGLLTRHGDISNFTVRRIPIENVSPYQLLSRSSNGMACFQTTNGHFLLHNLFTGASYKAIDIPLQEYNYIFWTCYGFGYDRYAEDYTIVVVYNYKKKYLLKGLKEKESDIKTLQNKDNSQFWVYSFKNHAWKPLFGFLYDEYNWAFSCLSPACSLNGVLHWFVPRGENENKEVIVTYDLHTCRFGEILVPMADRLFWANLSELGGKLCCSWIHEKVSTLYVWVMKEYGVKESWTMLFSIDCKRISFDGFIHRLVPMELFECRDGRKVVLFVCPNNGVLSWYDIDKDEVEIIAKLEEKVGNWQEKRMIDYLI